MPGWPMKYEPVPVGVPKAGAKNGDAVVGVKKNVVPVVTGTKNVVPPGVTPMKLGVAPPATGTTRTAVLFAGLGSATFGSCAVTLIVNCGAAAAPMPTTRLTVAVVAGGSGAVRVQVTSWP